MKRWMIYAAAALGGTTYVAWMGKTTPADSIWFTTSDGSGRWSSQQVIRGASTTQAPASGEPYEDIYVSQVSQ